VSNTAASLKDWIAGREGQEKFDQDKHRNRDRLSALLRILALSELYEGRRF